MEGAERLPVRIDSDWNHYTYTYGEPPREAHVRFDVGRALQPCPDTHAQSVRIRVEGDTEGFEDALASTLTDVDCWLVGVLGFQGGATWVLQVEDRAGFAARRAAVEAAAVGTVQWQVSEGWGFFEDRVCPRERDWQRIADREQVERLATRGIDIHAPQPIRHGFFGDEGALDAIGEVLGPEGFAQDSASGRQLVLVATHPPVDISSRTVALARLAREHGALYEGWRLVEPGR